MRLSGFAEKFGFFHKIVFIESAIIFLVCAIFYSQFGSAKSDVINQTVAASELIGEEAGEFILHSDSPASGEFRAFLRSKHGQGGIFKSFNVAPTDFSVMFMKETQNPQAMNAYSERGYGVRDAGGIFSVSVPFLVGADGSPYGVVTVESSKTQIMRKVLEQNFLLYLALFIVLNNQVFILRYYAARKQRDIIDKNYARPYLKQHSIGALKVMRKILDEIVEDHPGGRRADEPKTGAPEPDKKSASKKIIPISEFFSKNR